MPTTTRSRKTITLSKDDLYLIHDTLNTIANNKPSRPGTWADQHAQQIYLVATLALILPYDEVCIRFRSKPKRK